MNKSEITNKIYDTLMQNTTNPFWNNHTPFEVDEVIDSEISADLGIIWIAMDNQTDWKITIEKC